MSRLLLFAILSIVLWSCSQPVPENAVETDKLPAIFPQNYKTTIPFNIAPINFRVDENANRIYVSIQGKNTVLKKTFSNNKTNWPVKEWAAFLDKNKGDSISFTVFTSENNSWKQFQSFSYFVSPDPIDNYMFYRLITPGYQTWNKMGLYQRQLSSFEETTILDNTIMPHSCMNCHTLAANNPDNMVFHIRENNSGTFIIKDGKVKKLVSKKETPFKSVSFPYWHPSAKYIAFSINKVRQVFPTEGTERAHAFDMGSDMVIYDVDKEEYFTSPLLYAEDAFESFPCFSPDGRSLYFITAPAAPMPSEIRNIQYSLCRIDFDPETATLGEKVDTLITPEMTGKSLTMPRISPNGKHIVLTFSDYGNFPAYNEEADLYLYNIADSTIEALDAVNSKQVESYHSWSSNGKWLVFSSRQMDGLFMNSYFSHVDENGKFDSPFLLPQKDPDFHKSFLFSFNLPELAIKPMPVSPQQIEKTAKGSKTDKRTFNTTH
ncbi:TolB family protein [Maribellus mangrovi]|uniref:TolB family protein n=1 Tax=Maribellus mangrovi TaxID=3133146 RepID=UPI0030EBA996